MSPTHWHPRGAEGRSVTDKLLAVIFPFSAFVAAGFEHGVANWRWPW